MTEEIQPGVLQENRYLIFGPYEDGGCSSVDWGWDTQSNKWVVLKKLKSENLKKIQEEIRISRIFNDIHQCVPCNDFFTIDETNRKHYVLVFDYIDHIPLRTILPKMNWTDISRFSGQFLWLLHKFHERGVIHRDIKPGNVLLDKITLDLRIIDFGMCIAGKKEADSSHWSWREVSAKSGTTQFLSPEQERAIQRNEPFYPTPAIDLWSFGCILLEWWIGKGPAFPNSSQDKWVMWQKIWSQGDIAMKRRSSNLVFQLDYVLSLKRPDLEYDGNNRFLSFLSILLDPYPNRRENAKKLLKHPFITQNEYQKCFLYDLVSRTNCG